MISNETKGWLYKSQPLLLWTGRSISAVIRNCPSYTDLVAFNHCIVGINCELKQPTSATAHGNTLRFPWAAGEPLHATAFQCLTYAFLPIGVFVYFPELIRRLLTINHLIILKSILILHQSGWVEGGDSSGDSTCPKTRRVVFLDVAWGRALRMRIRPQQSRTAATNVFG